MGSLATSQLCHPGCAILNVLLTSLSLELSKVLHRDASLLGLGELSEFIRKAFGKVSAAISVNYY
jgi:hypothetical protein